MITKMPTQLKCKYCGAVITIKDRLFFASVCDMCYLQSLSEWEFIEAIEVVL